MPKETLEIRQFKGFASTTDPHDLPIDRAYYLENVDITTRKDVLIGLPKDKATGTSTSYAGDFSGLFGDEGNLLIVDIGPASETGGTDSLHALNLASNGTVTLLKTQASIASYGRFRSIIPDGNAVHVGMGGASSSPAQFVGNLQRRHKWTSPANDFGWTVANAEVTSRAFGVVPHATKGYLQMQLPWVQAQGAIAGGGSVDLWDPRNYLVRIPFDTDIEYFAAAVYDYSQEGPLEKLIKIDIHRDNIWIYYGNPTTETGYDGGHAWLSGDTEVWDVAIGDGLTGLTEVENWKLSTGAVQSVVDAGRTNKMLEPCAGLRKLQFRMRIAISGTQTSAAENINKRVTGVKIYRKDTRYENYKPAGVIAPRLVNTYDLTDESTRTYYSETGDSTERFNTTSSAYYYIDVSDMGPAELLPYEGESGLPPELPHMTVNYGLGVVSSGVHVVGRPYIAGLGGTESWLLRSKPWRFDTFNWISDYMVLGGVPTALSQLNSRVYAFCANSTFVIDPNIWDTVETWTGIGCIGQKTVVSNERGMFWADYSNIYWHDGNTVHPIGSPVLHVSEPGNRDIGWLQRDTAFDPCMVFIPHFQSILLTYKVSGVSLYVGLLFHLESGSWTIVKNLATAASSDKGVYHAHVTVNGRPIIADSTGQMYFVCADTPSTSTGNRRKWRYVSPQLLPSSLITKVYEGWLSKLILQSDVDAAFTAAEQEAIVPTVYYYKDDPDYQTKLNPNVVTSDLYANNSLLRKVEFRTAGADWGSFRDFAVEIMSDNAGDSVVGGISISIRRITQR